MSDLLSEAKDGLSQQERKIAALFPSNFPIDDKDSLSLLRYMYDFSAQINYYNLKNEIEGDWRDFFHANADLLILLTSGQDYGERLTTFEHIEMQIQVADSDHALLKGVNKLFAFLQQTTEGIGVLQNQFNKIFDFNQKLRRLIDETKHYDDLFVNFSTVYHQFRREFGDKINPVPVFDNSATTDQVEDYFKDEDLTPRERVTSSVKTLKSNFHELRSRYNQFLAALNYYLRGYDMFNRKQPPHIALCLAFINLYQYLQQQINQLPGKHLDFYYQRILKLPLRPAEPDSAYIFFEPEPQVEMVYLKPGEELLADIPGKPALIYRTNNALQITNARIEDLKTLYVSRQSWDSLTAQIDELLPYQSDCPVVRVDDIIKNKQSNVSWAALGEDQAKFGIGERTMTDTQLATIIASPLLYLSEGTRKITITIYPDDASITRLDNFIYNFGKLNSFDSDDAQMSFELFNDVFTIDFTAEKGWLPVKKYSIVYVADGTDKTIQIKIQLDAGDPAIVQFDPGVHGALANAILPAIRLNLNNDASVNGYSFLRGVKLKRIKIRASVRGFRDVKLYNNFGALSTVTPFQPFGPQPIPGSPFVIKNTNIFNRFTKRTNIYLEWIGLPEVLGGWESYYKAYHLNIHNDSFKIKVSSINSGKPRPDEKDRQEINLFSTETDPGGQEVLLQTSTLEPINMRLLEFSNYPLMAKENDVAVNSYNDGALSLELSSPADGFGDRAYPQIVTGVMSHNARRLTRKRPLPNAPYVPIVKTITIDYLLETVDALTSARDGGEENNVSIFHIYPFGYNQAYPLDNQSNVTFFAELNKNRNLYIGLSGVLPGQELSLHFYLEEENFVNSISSDTIISWSYLHHNNWINLGQAAVNSDSTNALVNSGIVKLKMPSEIHVDNTILPEGLFWLRASTEDYNDVYARILAINTNAVLVTRSSVENTTDYDLRLAAGTIKAFNNKINGIKSIRQPLATFNGKQAETVEDYYVRISERLCHKDRPQTLRQIEQFILQAFPEILMAKCITRNETDIDQACGVGATIKVILIPKGSNGGFYLSNEPKVNMATLFKVRRVLVETLPERVNVQVSNPIYEKVKIVAEVTFSDNDTANQQAYLNQLIDDIRAFFCPWLSDAVDEIKIGSKVFVADMLSFIKGLPYVSQVTGFSMVHFYKSKHPVTKEYQYNINDLAVSGELYLQGSVPEAILIPSDEHLIKVSNTYEYVQPVPVGIGDLSISDEFLVTDEQADLKKRGIKQVEDIDDENEYFNLTISHI